MRVLVRLRKAILALALGLPSYQVLADEMPAKPAGADGNAASGDFVSFYERAATLTAALGGEERDLARHRDLARYKIECSLRRPSGGYFTLARKDGGRVALFVATEEGPVRDLQKVVSVGTYSSLFRPPEQWGGTRDWGWIYDRNGDGWVDYFTFLDGPMPVVSDDIAHFVPRKPGVKPGQPVKIESKEEIALVVESMQLVFTHHADDNYDGRSDAVVAGIHHPENPMWIHRYGVLRSRAFTQIIDEDWSFVSDIGIKAGSVPRENGDFQVSYFRGDGGRSPAGTVALETSSKILAGINDGIRACRIPNASLPRE